MQARVPIVSAHSEVMLWMARECRSSLPRPYVMGRRIGQRLPERSASARSARCRDSGALSILAAVLPAYFTTSRNNDGAEAVAGMSGLARTRRIRNIEVFA